MFVIGIDGFGFVATGAGGGTNAPCPTGTGTPGVHEGATGIAGIAGRWHSQSTPYPLPITTGALDDR